MSPTSRRGFLIGGTATALAGIPRSAEAQTLGDFLNSIFSPKKPEPPPPSSNKTNETTPQLRAGKNPSAYPDGPAAHACRDAFLNRKNMCNGRLELVWPGEEKPYIFDLTSDTFDWNLFLDATADRFWGSSKIPMSHQMLKHVGMNMAGLLILISHTCGNKPIIMHDAFRSTLRQNDKRPGHDSGHCYGKCVDVHVDDFTPEELFAALGVHFDCSRGLYQTFTHLGFDGRSSRHIAAVWGQKNPQKGIDLSDDAARINANPQSYISRFRKKVPAAHPLVQRPASPAQPDIPSFQTTTAKTPREIQIMEGINKVTGELCERTLEPKPAGITRVINDPTGWLKDFCTSK